MILALSILIILIISIILAVRSVDHEMTIPKEVVNLKIRKDKKTSGVILFLRKKIVHYSSKDS